MTEAQKRAYEADGVVLVEDALSPEQVSRAREAFDRAEAADHDRWKRQVDETDIYPELHDIPHILDVDDVFVDMVDHSNTLPLVRYAVGADVQLIGTQARMYWPGPSYVAWHRDVHFFPCADLEYSSHYHVKLMYYLQDVTEDGGCFGFVPGSHKFGRHTPIPWEMERYEDMPGHVKFPCRAGSAILFHCHGIHTAFPNNSDEPRRGLIYSYGHFWSKNGPSAILRDLDRLANTPLRRQLFGVALDQEAVKRERLHLPLQVVPKVGSSRAQSMKRYDLSEVEMTYYGLSDSRRCWAP